MRARREAKSEGATKAPLLAQVKLIIIMCSTIAASGATLQVWWHRRRRRRRITLEFQLIITWFYLFPLAAGKGHQLNTHLLVNQHEDVTNLRVNQKKKPKSTSEELLRLETLWEPGGVVTATYVMRRSAGWTRPGLFQTFQQTNSHVNDAHCVSGDQETYLHALHAFNVLPPRRSIRLGEDNCSMS